MKLSKSSGALIAAAAASLLIAGAVSIPQANAAAKKVACFGTNSCKGTSACKSGNHACKGQNSCKGQGFVELTKRTCKIKGGKVLG